MNHIYEVSNLKFDEATGINTYTGTWYTKNNDGSVQIISWQNGVPVYESDGMTVKHGEIMTPTDLLAYIETRQNHALDQVTDVYYPTATVAPTDNGFITAEDFAKQHAGTTIEG